MSRDYIRDRDGNEVRNKRGHRLFTESSDTNPKTVYEEIEPDYGGTGMGHTQKTNRRYDTNTQHFV